MGPFPAMTPAGEAAFSPNHPVPGFPQPGQSAESLTKLAATNDPFMLCDPLGFPRDLVNHSLSFRGGIWFEQVQNRTLMLFEQQRIWREVWTDGRELPKKVDARGAPDSRYYGYSVGHWDGDTFVVEANGFDPRSWVSEDRRDRVHGFPHSDEMKVEERYKRLDYGKMQATLTVIDPKVYTKPWVTVGVATLRPNAEIGEYFCVPSESIAFDNRSTNPSAGAKSDIQLSH